MKVKIKVPIKKILNEMESANPLSYTGKKKPQQKGSSLKVAGSIVGTGAGLTAVHHTTKDDSLGSKLTDNLTNLKN